ncbi:hypothetical protein J6590_041665 [Homalodisca vitripennis]|nr:hypothetical protein J6590_041665 [Homalodisca vitripennis]
MRSSWYGVTTEGGGRHCYTSWLTNVTDKTGEYKHRGILVRHTRYVIVATDCSTLLTYANDTPLPPPTPPPHRTRNGIVSPCRYKRFYFILRGEHTIKYGGRKQNWRCFAGCRAVFAAFQTPAAARHCCRVHYDRNIPTCK